MQVDAIKQQLDSGNVVLLTNLAYSAAGEVLSCNIYDVATHAAIEMEADKLICMTLKVCPGLFWRSNSETEPASVLQLRVMGGVSIHHKCHAEMSSNLDITASFPSSLKCP